MTIITFRQRFTTAVLALGFLASISACGTADPTTAASQAATPSAIETSIPDQQVNEELRNALPAAIRDAGEITSVNTGSFPPYQIVGEDGSFTGAQADLLNAIGQLWGIKTKNVTVDGLSGILTGLAAGRYQIAFGPVGDFKSREAKADFVDYVQEYVVFAVPKGNPHGIKSIEDTCGLKISVMAGGSAEKTINTQSEKCVAAGKPAIQVSSFKDTPTSLLAVKSNRADAFFSSKAPLTYYVNQDKDALELAGTESQNGFDTLYQGAVLPKDSELTPIVQKSLQLLFDNGTYAKILAKWGIDGNKIPEPGLNLAKS